MECRGLEKRRVFLSNANPGFYGNEDADNYQVNKRNVRPTCQKTFSGRYNIDGALAVNYFTVMIHVYLQKTTTNNERSFGMIFARVNSENEIIRPDKQRRRIA